MMTLHPGFRRLVLKNIPKLRSEDLDNYDRLLALRWELVHRRAMVDEAQGDVKTPQGSSTPTHEERPGGPQPIRDYRELPSQVPHRHASRREIDQLIDETTRQANRIIARYRKEFDALHKLWVARRNFALHQGGMLQIPSDPKDLANFLRALRFYIVVQAQTLPALTANRIKNIPWGRVLAAAATAGLVLYGLGQFESKDPGQKPPPQPPPDSTMIRQ